MKVILDTNVLVSGIFFSGPPSRILRAWRDGKITLVVSLEILDEYYRVTCELAARFPGVDVGPIIDLVAASATVVDAPAIEGQVCADPADDKFLGCAAAANVKHIISGDKHLLAVSGFEGVSVIRPAQFVRQYLPGS